MAVVTLLILIVLFCRYTHSVQIIHNVNHLLLIGIDGFGGEYLSNATEFLPTMKQLIFNGSYTFRARNAQPTVSAPNWISILTGLRPIASGVNSNEYKYPQDLTPNASIYGISPVSYNYSSIYPALPTIFDILKQYNPNIVTAAIYNWEWLHDLFGSNDNIDHKFWTQNATDDDTGIDEMIKFIDNFQPNLMFTYFGSLDESGHHTYWGSNEYYNTSVDVDKLIEKLIIALKNNDIFDKTQIIITADHGGYRSVHGDFNAANIFIPVIFYGPCINKNMDISPLFIENIDIAPMILNSFGFDVKELRYLKGRIYDEIYENHCIVTNENDNHMEKLLYYAVIAVSVLILLCVIHIVVWIVITCRKKKNKNPYKPMPQITETAEAFETMELTHQ